MEKLYIEKDIEEIVSKISGFSKEFSGKRILLTGAGGFLGRYFTATLAYLNQHVLDKPCEVIALDNFITSNNPVYNEQKIHGIQYVKHDVILPFEDESKFDFILHAAGIASPFYYRKFPLETMDVAINGTRSMLERAKRDNAKLLFFSSSEIYGDPDSNNVPTGESYRGNVSCLGARACYDESKRVGETLCKVYHTIHGVKSNMVRPFNVYGPGMQEQDYRVLPNFASRMKAGRPFNLYGDGRQTRTFCYITDAIYGFLSALVSGIAGEPYNIGNPNPEISMIDLVNMIEKIYEMKISKHVVEYPDSYPADEPLRRCPDITKARTQLNYHPTVGLEEGLRRFFDWTNAHFSGEL